MRHVHLSVLAVVVLGLAGCGGGNEGVVAGTVTVGGQPPTQQGMVTFTGTEGDFPPAFTASIMDGQFSSNPIPVGTYRVSVTFSGRMYVSPPATVTGNEPMPKTIVIDPKYTDPGTSGLQFTVQPGKNEWNFELDVTKK